MVIRHFILSPEYSLRGWKLLPYAVQNLHFPETLFFTENQWELILSCDGNTPVDWESLLPDQKQLYEKLLRKGIIVPCETGTALSPQQRYRLYPARFKEEVIWSVTGRCNLNCRHCFMSAPNGVQGEPSFSELMAMLDSFERCGIKAIQLTGGEPTVRRDFWQLVDEILKRTMIITVIFSNGVNITDSFLDQLEMRRIRPVFQFSFDGKGHHDWLRGTPGAERAVISAMERCRERGIPFGASMVLYRENKGSIRETVSFLARLECKYLKVNGAFSLGEWKNHPEHHLSQEEVYEVFLEYIPLYFEDGKPLNIELEGFFSYDVYSGTAGAFYDRNVSEGDFGKTLMCSHARREMYISPKGKVLPCMSMAGSPIEEKFPNILETPLEEILGTDSEYMDMVSCRVSDFMEHNAECRSCEYRTKCCGGCRAIAVRDHPEDYLAKDEVICKYYRNGWHDKLSQPS